MRRYILRILDVGFHLGSLGRERLPSERSRIFVEDPNRRA